MGCHHDVVPGSAVTKGSFDPGVSDPISRNFRPKLVCAGRPVEKSVGSNVGRGYSSFVVFSMVISCKSREISSGMTYIEPRPPTYPPSPLVEILATPSPVLDLPHAVHDRHINILKLVRECGEEENKPSTRDEHVPREKDQVVA